MASWSNGLKRAQGGTQGALKNQQNEMLKRSGNLVIRANDHQKAVAHFAKPKILPWLGDKFQQLAHQVGLSRQRQAGSGAGGLPVGPALAHPKALQRGGQVLRG